MEKAKKFVPSIANFTLATAAASDANVQAAARAPTQGNLTQGLFAVDAPTGGATMAAVCIDHPILGHLP